MSSFRLKSSITFLLLYFLISFSAFSQFVNSLPLQTIDEENGLSDNSVQCIYKGQRGFIWVGTKSGLNLIDGSTISVFKNMPNDKNSISSNIINSISGDANGTIWIGTDHGLNYFNPLNRKFQYVPLDNNSQRNDNVTCIAINTDNIVFISTSFGLYFYNQVNRKLSFIDLPGSQNEKLLNNRITHIGFDTKGILYLSTFNGLWSYDVSTRQFNHEVSAANDPEFTGLFTNFIFDHEGKIWIGTWDKGLKEFDTKTKKVFDFLLNKNNPFNVQSLTEVKQQDGSWGILLNDSLEIFNPKKNTLTRNFINQKINFDVTFLFTSLDKWVWIGTNKGLFFYNPSRNIIHHHEFPNSISSQGISILEWRNNLLLGGSNQNFLKLYDADLNEKRDYSKEIGKMQVSCLSMQMEGADVLKCGTSEGIAAINLNTGAKIFYQLTDTEFSKPGIKFITDIFQDSQKKWWAFPWRHGIWVSDSSGKKYKQVFNNFITEYGLPKPLVIGAACEDKNGNLWLGDYDEGVIFYDRNTGEFSKPFVKFIGSRTAISQILYHKGYCYTFNNNTLLTWNVDSIRLHEFKLPSSIDKPITSVAIDSTGNIWMATQRGLVAYNLNTNVFRHFTTSDGLLSNAMNGTLYCSHSGMMVYGCAEYISSFNPADLLKSIDVKPHIQLTEVIVNGYPYLFNPLKEQYFKHDLNNFIFKWTVTDYSNPLNNRYSYKLEGIDKDWRLAGREGKIEFANLSSGDYTLLLKAENSNGVGADKILKLKFAIKPPFWNTWWFIVLIALAIGVFFYSLFRYRINQLKKIENLRNRISLNLHDDIGSTLSSISILSDMALHHKKDAEAWDMLKEIKENSLSMMERMDDIVWSINPKNDSLEDLFLRIKTFAAKLFEAKAINYKINISDEIKNIHLEMEYRQHIYLIMKEAINNLIKYSKCTEASIVVERKASQLSIVLMDNGIGFDKKNLSFGNGLNNMRKRAKEILADIDIDSQKNKGTKITLIAKIK